MSFDGVVIRAIVHELNQIIVGGKIRKIYQPHKRELTFLIRSHGKNYQLRLSAHSAFPRIHLTTAKEQNPQEPPPFCMILRKFCEGGWIESIQQVGLERIVHLNIFTRNEIGDRVFKRVIVEMMGKHSNIILVDPKKNIILDSIVHVNQAMSQVRQLSPGVLYTPPPSQHKINPLNVVQDSFIAGFDYNGGKLDQQIVQRFTGLGPQIAKEILHRSGLGRREQLWQSFHSMMTQIQQHHYQPSIIETDKKTIFSVIPLTFIRGKVQSFTSVNQCVDQYYTTKVKQDRFRQQMHELRRLIDHELSKNKKKLKRLEKEYADDQKAEETRLYGELLMASLHQIKRGALEVEVVNFFDPNYPTVKIPLDPARTPAENAERYFKKYRKYKASKTWNHQQREKTMERIEYLESVRVQLLHADPQEMEQIREELTEVGLIKSRQQEKRKKVAKPTPLHVYSSDQTLILVGKNNRQNDYLLQKIASAQDTWLHTKEIPGSHVVIRGTSISPSTLIEAAMLAAYFSKARESSQVPVDYTLVKHVKKPKGAHPGFVTYKKQKTLFVTPDPTKIQQLLEQSSEG